MTWKRYAGRLGATTLGFAFGDLPGAIAGYKAFDLYEKAFPEKDEMPKRKRSGGATGSAKRARFLMKGRRVLRKATSRASKRPYRSRPYYVRPSTYVAGQTVYRAAKVKMKRKKVAKIPPALKKAVKHIVAGDKPVGTLVRRSLNNSVAVNVVNGQKVWDGNLDGGPNMNGYSFTVDQIVNAASVMFNGAFATNTVAFNKPTLANRFGANTKFDVIDSHTLYFLKNVTTRELHIDVYEFAAKDLMSHVPDNQAQIWTFNGTTYTGVTGNGEQAHNPSNEWLDAFSSDFQTNSVSTGGPTAYSAVNISTIGVTPDDSITLKKRFRIGKLKRIKLEPGQEAKVFLQGPSKFTLDLAKCFQKGVYMNVQRYTRATLFVMNVDAAAGTTSGFSRAATSSGNGALVVDRKDYYKIACPEQASETNQKTVKIIDVYVGSSAGTLFNVGEESKVNV
jgi:hypothetical protein